MVDGGHHPVHCGTEFVNGGDIDVLPSKRLSRGCYYRLLRIAVELIGAGDDE